MIFCANIINYAKSTKSFCVLPLLINYNNGMIADEFA